MGGRDGEGLCASGGCGGKARARLLDDCFIFGECHPLRLLDKSGDGAQICLPNLWGNYKMPTQYAGNIPNLGKIERPWFIALVCVADWPVAPIQISASAAPPVPGGT